VSVCLSSQPRPLFYTADSGFRASSSSRVNYEKWVALGLAVPLASSARDGSPYSSPAAELRGGPLGSAPLPRCGSR